MNPVLLVRFVRKIGAADSATGDSRLLFVGSSPCETGTARKKKTVFAVSEKSELDKVVGSNDGWHRV